MFSLFCNYKIDHEFSVHADFNSFSECDFHVWFLEVCVCLGVINNEFIYTSYDK